MSGPITIGRVIIDGASGHSIYGSGWMGDDTYQRGVAGVVRRIRQTQTGRILIEAIGRTLRIVPNPNQNQCNAGTRPAPQYFIGFVPTTFDQNRRDATRTGEWACPITAAPAGLGTGRGADVVIEFTPDMFTPGNQLYCAAGNPILDNQADVALVHELFHGLQMTRGRMDCRPLQGSLAGYRDRSEYNAILVENIYRSETRRSLRRNWNTTLLLANPLAFYGQPENVAMIDELYNDMPEFTRRLAGVCCHFNPLREFYRDLNGLPPRCARPTGH